MALTEKYRHFTRDRHNVLWTTYIYTSGFLNGTVLYGLLYPRYVVVDSRNIAAVGWHVPTKAEYETLIAYLGGASVAGGKLKDTGYTYWNSPNEGATNESGFTARGAGIRDYEFGTFSGKNLSTDLWTTTTEYGAYVVCELHYVTASAYLLATNPGYGASIRLIKDDSVLTPYGGNDGKQYQTVKIGTQVWLAENLCETKYRNEDAIPEVTSNTEWVALSTGALCSYNNDWDYAFTGFTIDLVGAGPEPARIEFCNESDDPFDPIKSSRAIIAAWANSMFAHDELYYEEDMHYWVEIFQEEDLFWAGWVDPHQCAEPYGPVPYISTIYSTDGLTLLKNILYDDNGTYYSGRKLESQIVLDILDKIGFLEFKEYVNLYEESMDDGLGDSPFDQLSINTDIFKDMNCDEVLKEILKKYGACIRMVDGIFCIYRIAELTGATVYGRHFTGPVTKTAISFTPKHYIKRTGHSSALLEVKTGARMIQGPAKKVIGIHDLGNRESWVNNWDFKAEKFNTTTNVLENWTNVNPTYLALYHVSEMIANQEEGIAIGSTNAFQATGIEQIMGYAVQSATDRFTLDFEFGWYNNTTPNNSVTNVYLEIKCGSYYLKETDDNFAEWTLTPSYISIFPVDVLGSTTVPSGFTGWFQFKREIVGITVAGNIEILAGGQLIANIYNCYHFIKFYVSSYLSDQKLSTALKPVRPIRPDRQSTLVRRTWDVKLITVKQHTYEKTNNINGKELQYDFLLGDVLNIGIQNIIGQFAGSLARSAPQTKQDTITLTGTSGSANVTCNGVTRLIEWDTSLTVTATNFKFVNAVYYLPIYLISYGETLIFTHNVAGSEFSGPTTITNVSGDLNGTVETTQETYYLVPTTIWHTRGGTEDKALLQIVVDEIASHYSRPKHFLDLPILEVTKAASTLNLLGNFQDTINTFNNYLRAFAINRGSFDIKMRKWQFDLIEIGQGEPSEGGPESVTVDTTEVTVDTTEVTVDHT